jgi:hypothetical protein
MAANAQVVTGDLLIRVNVDNTGGGLLERADFAYQVDGAAATNWPLSGIVLVPLDVSVPHTVAPVPQTGYTFADNGNCTDVSVNASAATLCLITFTFIPPATTTTTTTTTTTVPQTTTTPPVGQTTVHGSDTAINGCTLHLNPPLQGDSTPNVTVTLASDASPQPHLGDPITLSGTTLGLGIPASILQAGVDANLIKGGDKVPSTATVVVAGSNTVEQTHAYSVQQTATIKVVGGKAAPLNVKLSLSNTTWTPVNNTSDVLFTEKSLKIVSTLSLPGLGEITATFTCAPKTTLLFVALGATGAPATTGGGGTTPTSAGGPGGGGTTGGPVVSGAQELPRTGSNPWPLVVVAAGFIDLGMLAIAGAKRRRRPLHH